MMPRSSPCVKSNSYYGDFQALFGVSLNVEAGQVVAVIGANGAGKSTLLRCISGLMHPRHGEISFNGASIRGMPAFHMVRHGIAMVPEGRRLFPSLTVEENILIGGQTRRPGPWTISRGLQPVSRVSGAKALTRNGVVRRPATDGRNRARAHV